MYSIEFVRGADCDSEIPRLSTKAIGAPEPHVPRKKKKKTSEGLEEGARISPGTPRSPAPRCRPRPTARRCPRAPASQSAASPTPHIRPTGTLQRMRPSRCVVLKGGLIHSPDMICSRITYKELFFYRFFSRACKQSSNRIRKAVLFPQLVVLYHALLPRRASHGRTSAARFVGQSFSVRKRIHKGSKRMINLYKPLPK